MSKVKKPVSRFKPEALIPFTESSTTIECMVKGCQEGDGEWQVDDDYAALSFFQKGWRATQNKVYCPKHAKQKLKNP